MRSGLEVTALREGFAQAGGIWIAWGAGLACQGIRVLLLVAATLL